MNKAHLIESIRNRHGNRLTAEEAVDAVLDSIARELADGGSVSVTGFGTMHAAPVAAHWARNPKTNERVWLPETRRVRFRAGQNLMDLVSGAKKVPVIGSAVRKAPKGSLQKG